MPSAESERSTDAQSESSQRAQYAALIRASRERGDEMTRAAREARERSWYESTDPALPEAERQRQAAAARKAFYLNLSRKGVLAQKRLRAAVQDVVQAEAEAVACGG